MSAARSATSIVARPRSRSTFVAISGWLDQLVSRGGREARRAVPLFPAPARREPRRNAEPIQGREQQSGHAIVGLEQATAPARVLDPGDQRIRPLRGVEDRAAAGRSHGPGDTLRATALLIQDRLRPLRVAERDGVRIELEQAQHRRERRLAGGTRQQRSVTTHVLGGIVRAITPQDHRTHPGRAAATARAPHGAAWGRWGRRQSWMPSQFSSRYWKRPMSSEMRDITVYP